MPAPASRTVTGTATNAVKSLARVFTGWVPVWVPRSRTDAPPGRQPAPCVAHMGDATSKSYPACQPSEVEFTQRGIGGGGRGGRNRGKGGGGGGGGGEPR